MRRAPSSQSDYDTAQSRQGPDKVLKIVPMDGGIVSFSVDFDQHDGSIGLGERASSDPLEVAVQLGEFQVMTEIMRSSIPTLVGWKTMTDIAMQRNLNDALQGTGSSDSGFFTN